VTVRNVHCVLKGGGRYTPKWVRRLFDGVMQHWPADEKKPTFRCLTDMTFEIDGVHRMPLINDWAGWWSKFELFKPGNLAPGGTLYLDLDIVPVRPMNELAGGIKNFLTFAPDPRGINSGIIRLPWPFSADGSRIYRMAQRDMKRWPGLFEGDQDAMLAVMSHPDVRVSYRIFDAAAIADLFEYEAGKQCEVVHLHGATKQDNLPADHPLMTGQGG
jgi:hypothetical protein